MLKEEYDNYRQVTRDVRHWRGDDIVLDNSLLDLIESLRTVARAADATSDSGVGRLWERRADEYERYNVGGEEMRRMRQALDALPQWVLEANDE